MHSESEKTVLYLRGVPRSLVREAKAAAARQGRTLASLTCRALASALESGASDAPDALGSEMAWFEKSRELLLARYPGQYLAIVGHAVLDHDPEFSALAERVFKKGARAVFMPRLTPKATAIRIRSPRVRA